MRSFKIRDLSLQWSLVAGFTVELHAVIIIVIVTSSLVIDLVADFTVELHAVIIIVIVTSSLVIDHQALRCNYMHL